MTLLAGTFPTYQPPSGRKLIEPFLLIFSTINPTSSVWQSKATVGFLLSLSLSPANRLFIESLSKLKKSK